MSSEVFVYKVHEPCESFNLFPENNNYFLSNLQVAGGNFSNTKTQYIINLTNSKRPLDFSPVQVQTLTIT